MTIMLLDSGGLDGIYFYRQACVRRQLRYYYLSEPPILALVVSRIGGLHDFAYSFVDCAMGFEQGYPGFCVPGFEHQLHSKLTIYRLLDDTTDTAEPDVSLGIFLQNSRRG